MTDFYGLLSGDIPPMYLDIHEPKTTKQVLENYIRLADEWIENVKSAKSVEECFPFKAEPTLELEN